MGQKVNPIGLRLGINKTWDSYWWAKKDDFARFLKDDYNIRKYINSKFSQAGISKIIIKRPANKIKINMHVSRPGVIIGKKGVEIDTLKKNLSTLTNSEVALNINEIKKPEFDAQLIADNIAMQLEKRISFRRAVKRAIQTAIKFGIKGIRINCSGRLGGAEMARTEWYREGNVPLHTLRADVDYATSTSHTTYGVIGIKVWTHKKDSLIGSKSI